jgi:aspartate 1-decarboxylase
MLKCLLRAKIHEATVTESNIEYEGSLTVDETLLKATGIGPYEQVMVSNLNNGERFETYVITGKKDSGVICLNGPAARKGVTGDKIIIFSYGYYTEDDLSDYSPILVRVDEKNRITGQIRPSETK